MKAYSVPIIILVAAVASSCAPAGTASGPQPLTAKQTEYLQKELGDKVPGKPVNCIANFNANNIIRVSDDIVLFRQSARLVYQNKLRYTCQGLSSDDDIIVTESYGSQKCRGDLLKLVDRTNGIPGPVCSLGEFVPYLKSSG